MDEKTCKRCQGKTSSEIFEICRQCHIEVFDKNLWSLGYQEGLNVGRKEGFEKGIELSCNTIDE